VQLEENHAQKTFDMRVLDVSDLHMSLAYRGPIPIPRSDAVFNQPQRRPQVVDCDAGDAIASK
jgi:hypothetical protein